MRIVIIADHAVAEGGAPQVAIASARGLAELGHPVTYVQGVAGPADAALDHHPDIRRIDLGGTDIWHKGALAAARDGIWNRELITTLKTLLTGFSPEDTVVHIHQWTKCFSPSVFAAVRKAGLPLVTTLHDYFLACPTGLMYRPDKGEACTLKPLSAACLAAPCDPRSYLHKGIRIARSLALGRALDGLDFTAIHVSAMSEKIIGPALPPRARQVIVENPIECVDSGPRIAGPDLRIVYCGRLTAEKGADLVAEAAKAAGLPSLFIGEGPLRDKIKAIDPTAEITGWLEKPAVRDRIAREALAVIAPSRWPETGPLVIAEAMASGVPAIASTRAGAAGRIIEGETGFVVEPHVPALVSAFRKLTEADTAARMGAAAYHHFWAAPPSLAAHAKKLESVYRAAIARHTA